MCATSKAGFGATDQTQRTATRMFCADVNMNYSLTSLREFDVFGL